jgi:hypothetical protein
VVFATALRVTLLVPGTSDFFCGVSGTMSGTGLGVLKTSI